MFPYDAKLTGGGQRSLANTATKPYSSQQTGRCQFYFLLLCKFYVCTSFSDFKTVGKESQIPIWRIKFWTTGDSPKGAGAIEKEMILTRGRVGYLLSLAVPLSGDALCSVCGWICTRVVEYDPHCV